MIGGYGYRVRPPLYELTAREREGVARFHRIMDRGACEFSGCKEPATGVYRRWRVCDGHFPTEE